MYGELGSQSAHGPILRETLRTAVECADFPVTFDGSVGLYRPADAGSSTTDVAVLFVSSWGFEELCGRKLWRILAAELAGRGMGSLRFDYPGTGDALDVADSDGLSVWTDSILAAADHLRSLSGASRILLIGHGIGAAFAWHAARSMENVAGLAMLAPALSGRQWVREFMAISRIADHGLIEHAAPPTGPTMGEQSIPAGILSDIRAIDYRNPDHAPVSQLLMFARDGRAADATFLQKLETLSVATNAQVFDEYAEFTRDVLFSVPPRRAIATLAEWATGIAAEPAGPKDHGGSGASPAATSRGAEQAAVRAAHPRPSAASVPRAAALRADGFCETPLRFGDNQSLYGILCEPIGPRRGATVMILSTGYDRMSGWGRITTRICRDLARAGIASFRFDFANIADSPPQPDAPEQIIYNDCQVQDVRAALSLLEGRNMLPVLATGRCSGGYTAFQSACADDRIGAVVAVNVFDFHIDPTADVDKIISASLQPLSDYGRKMASGGFWRRSLRGEVDLRRAARNLLTMSLAKVMAILQPVTMRLSIVSHQQRKLMSAFRALEAKKTRMSIIYSERDVGISTLEANFGRRGRLLTDRFDVDIEVMTGSDHNLTTAPAREHWCARLKDMALAFQAQRRREP